MNITCLSPSNPRELDCLAALAHQLWPHHSPEELRTEFCFFLSCGGAVFAAWEEEQMVGFAQCSLRHDYVEGCSHSPVGYLEGIFVLPQYRHRGISRQLLSSCESWAKQQGCLEFASDCELTNVDSLHFHLACGFQEANRIICFQKEL